MTSPVHPFSSGLPIDAIVPEVRHALEVQGSAVVHASPGAGKTTVLPLTLLDSTWLGARRIVMLEPRRLAARAAAHRMARLLSEPVGRTVGYRTRLDTVVSAATRIEVVTEGVLTRIAHGDPTLDDYALVIFDEFHERSLHADLGLALSLHARRLVRPDLRLLVMSATVDGTAVARLLDGAPVITSLGREHEVETRYRPPPRSARPGAHLAGFLASIVRQAIQEEQGDILAFLPGAAEIHAVLRALAEQTLPPQVDVIPLHGSLQPADQDRAIAPSPAGRRKVVLATSIAETSLTIEGVRVVVDAGFSRRPRFSPRTGMSRLETTRVTRAAAEQRRGRAGRTAPGICYRLWDEAEQAALVPFASPEIVEGDLVPLVLDLAVLGIMDPFELDWLDAPPAAAVSQARELLRQLQALDNRGASTSHGRETASLAMHPRLAHMVLRSIGPGHGALACDLAALLTERDPLRRMSATGTVADTGVDIRDRVEALLDRGHASVADRGVLARIRNQARRWRSQLTIPDIPRDLHAVGRILALAFPDRVARRRHGTDARYLMRSGSGAVLASADVLGRESWLVVAESDGRSPESRVFLAASLTLQDVEDDFADQINETEVVTWDAERGIRAHVERRLGAIVLSTRVLASPTAECVGAALSEAIRRLGLDILPWSDAEVHLRQRLAFLHRHDSRWPDVSDETIVHALPRALLDELSAVRSPADLRRVDVARALLSFLTPSQRARLDRLAPTHIVAPTGTRAPIDYSDPGAPAAAIRIQELFGCQATPTVHEGRVPITLHLLSPARRPVQVTSDLSGFWRSSYFDVRKDLRARYPKHHWPDDPLSAQPTTRTRRTS